MSPSYRDAFFAKRLKWISQCAQIAHYRLHHFDYRKGNISRYFVEVFSIFIPKEYLGKWYLESVDLAKHACYYLGSYPNYWNLSNKKIVYAHDLMTARVYPMETEAVFYNEEAIKQSIMAREKMNIQGIPAKDLISGEEKSDMESLEVDFGFKNLINYLYPERMDKAARDAFMTGPNSIYANIDEAITKMAFFHKKFEIIEWLRQKYALAERKLRFDACVKARYPKPEKEPQYKILDPQGAKDFPGIPIDQMQLPAPTGQSVPRPPPKQMIIRLLFAFSIINVSSLNGYSLILNVEEVKE